MLGIKSTVVFIDEVTCCRKTASDGTEVAGMQKNFCTTSTKGS
jgi:hypothetical protein